MLVEGEPEGNVECAFIHGWLEELKPGWSARFASAFKAIGIEDASDLAALDDEILLALDGQLQAAGAKIMHVKRIHRAISEKVMPSSPLSFSSDRILNRMLSTESFGEQAAACRLAKITDSKPVLDATNTCGPHLARIEDKLANLFDQVHSCLVAVEELKGNSQSPGISVRALQEASLPGSLEEPRKTFGCMSGPWSSKQIDFIEELRTVAERFGENFVDMRELLQVENIKELHDASTGLIHELRSVASCLCTDELQHSIASLKQDVQQLHDTIQQQYLKRVPNAIEEDVRSLSNMQIQKPEAGQDVIDVSPGIARCEVRSICEAIHDTQQHSPKLQAWVHTLLEASQNQDVPKIVDAVVQLSKEIHTLRQAPGNQTCEGSCVEELQQVSTKLQQLRSCSSSDHAQELNYVLPKLQAIIYNLREGKCLQKVSSSCSHPDINGTQVSHNRDSVIELAVTSSRAEMVRTPPVAQNYDSNKEACKRIDMAPSQDRGEVQNIAIEHGPPLPRTRARLEKARAMASSVQVTLPFLERDLGAEFRHRSSKKYVAFICYHKLECAIEARFIKAELERLFAAPAHLNSDCTRDQALMQERVRESDVLVLLQSAEVLHQPWCLLELSAAIDQSIPIIAIKCAGKGYELSKAQHLLTYLDSQLDLVSPDASRMLRHEGGDPRELAFKLSSVVPEVTCIHFDASASSSVIKASLLELANAMQYAQPAPVPHNVDMWLDSRHATTGSDTSLRPADDTRLALLAPIPPTPLADFMGQSRVLDEIKEHLFCHQDPEGCHSLAVNLKEAGTAGRPVALALTCDPALRAHFDCVVYVSVGRDPVVRQLQDSVFTQLTGAALSHTITTQNDALSALRYAGAGRRVFMILDDVWNWDCHQALHCLDPYTASRLVVTTQVSGLLPGVPELSLSTFPSNDAVALLLGVAKASGMSNPPSCAMSR